MAYPQSLGRCPKKLTPFLSGRGVSSALFDGLRGNCTRLFHVSRGSGFDFSFLVSFTRSFSGGLLGRLGVVMASVGHIGEGSHNHDRDDHGATEEGNVRMTLHERQV